MHTNKVNAARLYRPGGFTLVEVLISLAIAAIIMGGTIYGYVNSARRAEWSAYSLAANSFALQRMEQMRACKWDLNKAPAIGDQVTSSSFPTSSAILDMPNSRSNAVYATNFTTITTVSSNPWLKCIRVDCVWYFAPRNRNFTNTIVSYRAPDNY